ncbi:hypothetical protein BC830DRAFT_1159213 [Chytriomyces sp. MP71]|nr:hypothetical protein BC830DRAFT_1159213 [Chytriomyces sp. MP71]
MIRDAIRLSFLLRVRRKHASFTLLACCALIIHSSMHQSVSSMELPWSHLSVMDSADGGMKNWLSVPITGDERPASTRGRFPLLLLQTSLCCCC